MAKKTLKIGMTGGIACGKTTAANFFAQLGVPIIDTDVIAHQLVEPGQPALQQIVETFGEDMQLPNGQLNRTRLRQRVFADPKQRERLEQILHPLIRTKMLAQAAQITTFYCLCCIPLLVETQQQNLVDRVLVIDCSRKKQRQRLKKRNQLTDLEIDQMLAAQTTRYSRLAIAHDVIYNNRDLKSLQQQILSLHQFYLTL
jgi:dephospho-CoA kinase